MDFLLNPPCGLQSRPVTALRKFRSQRLLLFAFLLGVLLPACQDQEVCEELGSNPLRIGFYHPGGEGQAGSAVLDSLSVYGLGGTGDSIYNNRRNVSRIELPLDISQDDCRFVLVFPGMVHDTLLLRYVRHPRLLSAECGFDLFFDLQEAGATGHYIFAIETVNNQVTNTLDEHIKVFIAPSDPAGSR
jgi:hypothetical protein